MLKELICSARKCSRNYKPFHDRAEGVRPKPWWIQRQIQHPIQFLHKCQCERKLRHKLLHATTILSPFTHARNFLSAGACATANGIIPFADPAAVKRAYETLQVKLPGARKVGVVRKAGETDAALRYMDVDAKATTMDGNITKPKGGEI